MATLTQTEFIELARAQVGKRYVLGAEASCTNPAPTAFDCSELVEWLMCRNGTPIKDLAAVQFDLTVPVSPGTEKTGDMVFLANNPARWNRIGHVAILTRQLASGDWEVIEARGRKWGVVSTTLSHWRRRARFAGVRRYPALHFATRATNLTTIGVRLRVDGVFGPATKRALQTVIGTPVDGKWGPASRRALQRWLGVRPDGIVGPITVRALQRKIGGTKVDGKWGPATTRAIQRYLNRQPIAL